MSRKLLKSTAVVGGMTLLSRISGLVRDMALAQVIGGGLVADAFFVAFRIPNFFRRIFGEGAFSQAFVPVFSEYHERRALPETQHFLDVTAGRFGLLLAMVTFAGVAAAPWIVTALAPGFLGDTEKFQLTVDCLRLTFPYLFFVSLVAMAAGILNGTGRFAAAAATPILLNLSMIAAVVWLVPLTRNAAIALSVGTLIAGVAQLFFQFPFLKGAGLLPHPRLRPTEEGSKRVFGLMLPAVFGVSVAQVNTLINTVLASFLVTGSVSWLYYSDRLMEFPLGVFGIALATVILPSLSRKHSRGDHDEFSRLLDWALRWVFLVAVPATAALMLLAEPLMVTLFQHGAFTPRDVQMSGRALVAFAVGLPGFILVKVLAPGFYARQDTKTPVKAATISVIANVAFAVLLVTPLAHVGLALAIALGGWVNAGLLYVWLRHQGIYRPGPGWAKYFLQVLLATTALAALLWWGVPDTQSWILQRGMHRVETLALWVTAGAAVYFASALIVGLRPRQLIMREAA